MEISLGSLADKASSRPRVAIFMDQLVAGSFPKIAGKEVRYFDECGLDVDLVLIKGGVPAKYEEFLAGLNMRCLDELTSIPFKVDFRFPCFSFFSLFHLTAPILAPLMLKKEYDMMISHATYTCFTAYALKKIRKIPYLAFVHDPIAYILHKIYRGSSLSHFLPMLIPIGTKIDKTIADAAEAVILPSKFHLEFMEKITKKPIEVVYHGVEAAEKIPSKRGDYFIAVARWEPGKRPFFILDILEGLKKRGAFVKLLMIGLWKPPLLRADFLREIRRRGLLGHVELFGVASEMDLKRLYLGARALIHTVTESFGMIGLEAAAHGAPIIIPAGSGVTELFSNGVHGFFPKEGDLDAYLEHVDQLASNERLAWKMGCNAWNVAKQYSWQAHAKKLENVVLRYLT